MPSTRLTVQRFGDLLRFPYEAQRELWEGIKQGTSFEIDVKGEPRNYEFHKKYFTMLNYAYQFWEPPAFYNYKGKEIPIQKSFETFREQILILAGHCEYVWTVKMEPRRIAKSLSYAKMSEAEMASVYSRTIDVILHHILPLKGMTPEQLNEESMNFLAAYT